MFRSKRRLVKSNSRCSIKAAFALLCFCLCGKKNAVRIRHLPKCHSTLFLTMKAPTALVLAHLPLSGKVEIGLNRSAAQVNMVLFVCRAFVCVCFYLFKKRVLKSEGTVERKKVPFEISERRRGIFRFKFISHLMRFTTSLMTTNTYLSNNRAFRRRF